MRNHTSLVRLLCLAGPTLVLFAFIGIPQVGAAPADVLSQGDPGTSSAPATNPRRSGGAHSVDVQSGGFSYSYPISVAPGRLGMEPSVSLRYSSSGAKRGTLAAGWSLPMMVIEPHPKNTRGNPTAPEWTAPLGGDGLIEVNEPNAEDGWDYFRSRGDKSSTRYRRKITYLGEFDLHILWEAHTLDGKVYRFGEEDLSPRYSARRPLTSITDRFGNRIEYKWFHNVFEPDFSTLMLQRIEYASNVDPATGQQRLPARARVDFGYGAEQWCPNTSDRVPVGGKVSGRAQAAAGEGAPLFVEWAIPLTQISRSVLDDDSGEWRQYAYTKLNYEPVNCSSRLSSPLRILESVQEFACTVDGGVCANGDYESAPPTSFGYHNVTSRTTPKSVDVPFPRDIFTSNEFASTGITEFEFETASILRGTPNNSWNYWFQTPGILTSKLLDVTGDGIPERLQADVTTGGACEIQVYSGSDERLLFAIDLPRLTWAGDPGNEFCSLTFQYTQENNVWSSLDPCTNDQVVQIGGFMEYGFFDVDLDGYQDLVTRVKEGQFFQAACDPEIELSSGQSCEPQTCLDPDYEKTPEGLYFSRWYRNLEGAGFDDTARAFETPFPVPLGHGPAFSNERWLCNGQGDCKWDYNTSHRELDHVRDVDGDGHVDFYLEGTSRRWLRHADGTLGTQVQTDPNAAFNTQMVHSYDVEYDSFDGKVTSGQRVVHPRYLVDFNNDGYPDVLENRSGSESGMWVRYGPFFGQAVQIDPERTSVEQREIYESQLSTARTVRQTTRILDFDGDGYPDIMTVDGSGLSVQYNLGGLGLSPRVSIAGVGSTSRAFEAWSSDYYPEFGADFDWYQTGGVQDLDGDGYPDFFESGARDWSPRNGEMELGGRAMRVRGVNGLGDVTLLETISSVETGTVRVTYERARDVVGGLDDRSRLPNTVVDSIAVEATRLDGTIDKTTMHYDYADPAFRRDRDGFRSFRGYSRVTTRNPLGGSVVATYDYDEYYMGLPVRSVVYDKGLVQQLTTTDFDEYFPYFDSRLPVFLPKVRTTFACDSGMTEGTCEQYGARVESETIYESVASAQAYYPRQVETRMKDSAAPSSLAAPTPSDPTAYDLRKRSIQEQDLLTSNGVYSVYFLRPLNARREAYLGDLIGWQLVSSDSVAYDERGFAPRRTDHVQNEGGTIATKYTVYGPYGQLRRTIKPEQFASPTNGGSTAPATNYIYDDNYRWARRIRNELGHTVDIETDQETGSMLETFGPNPDEHTKRVLDPWGRVKSVETKVDDGSGNPPLVQVVVNVYEDATSSSFASVTSKTLQELGGDVWVESTLEFDELGRPVRVTNVGSAASGGDTVATWSYLNGKLDVYTGPDPSDESTTPRRISYEYTYDGLGRAKTFRIPLSSGTVGMDYSYDGLLTTESEYVASPLAGEPMSVTRKRVDPLGRLDWVEELIDSDGTYAHTEYGYDHDGRMNYILDPDGVVTVMKHDFFGNRTEVSRSGKTWSYRYDRNSNLESIIKPHEGNDPEPFTTSILYDALDRRESRSPAEGGLSSAELDELSVGLTQFVYDEGPNGIGRLSREETPFAQVAFTYDVRGNVIRTDHSLTLDLSNHSGPILSDTRTVTTQYNAMNQPTVIEYPNAQPGSAGVIRTRTSYDDKGRPQKLEWLGPVSGPQGEVLAELHRNNAGKILEQTAFHDTRQTYTYDDYGRVKTDSVVKGEL